MHNGEMPNSAMQDELNADPEGLSKYGLADIEDIEAAEAIISFTTAGGGKGGRHIEFGYGLALLKRMILIGPRENIFHTLPCVQWHLNWAAFMMNEFDLKVGAT